MARNTDLFDDLPPAYNVAIRPGRLAIYKEINYGHRTAAQLEAQKNLRDTTAESCQEIYRQLTKPIYEVNYTALSIVVGGLKDLQKAAAYYASRYGRSLTDHLAEVVPGEMLNKLIESTGQDISDKARKRINASIDWLLALAESKTIKYYDKATQTIRRTTFKINFVTLTLPSSQSIPAEKWFTLPVNQQEFFTYTDLETKQTWISDHTIKARMLNQFLVELRDYLKKNGEDLKFYFWRAEAQKNGNIHFHLTTDKYIPWEWQRDTWNRIVNKAGFVDRYRESQLSFFANGFKARPELFDRWPLSAQLAAYQKGTAENWTNPNSTDVHSVKNIRNVGAYLAKYCTKGEKYRKIEGRKWYVSTALSKCKSIILPVEQCQSDIDVLEKKVKVKVLDYCVLMFCNISDWIKYDCETILKPLRAYMVRAKYGGEVPPLL